MFCICIIRNKDGDPPPPQKKKIKNSLSNWDFFVELGKKHTFWHWEWGQILAPKSGDREP